ncbi:MAG: hypothetical protein PHD95_01035 [Candidatus ainarchaeum sp.]|nr:hypothetical protein [Candidatus ainarchaeum sp.]
MAGGKPKRTTARRIAEVELKLLPKGIIRPRGSNVYPETMALLRYSGGIAALKIANIDSKRNRELVKQIAILETEYWISKNPAILAKKEPMELNLQLQAFKNGHDFELTSLGETGRLVQQVRRIVKEKIQSN